MQLILLVESHMLPVPTEGVEILQEFGSEHIRDDLGKMHPGTSMWLEAEPEVFVDWLQQFNGFWASNSPSIGDWKIVHIKRALVDIAFRFNVIEEGGTLQILMKPELASQYTDEIKKELNRRIAADNAAHKGVIDHDTRDRVTLLARRYFMELVLSNKIVFIPSP